MDDNISAASVAAPALILLLTIPTVWRFSKNPTRGAVKVPNDAALYEDKDGIATEESMKAYSTKTPFVFAFLALATGLCLSFASAVYGTVRTEDHFSQTCLAQIWVLFASWILALLQVLESARETHPIVKFKRCSFNAVSFVLIIVLAAAILLSPLPNYPGDVVLGALLTAQIFVSLAAGRALFAVDRRPDVFAPNGKVVERQFQRSLWARYAFSWSEDLLDVASNKLIDGDDLPAMDSVVRSKDAQEMFESIALKSSNPLWAQLLWAYRGKLAFQWSFALVSAISDAGPQFAVLKLLQYLEVREGFDAVDPRAWLWVGGLLAATLIETMVDNRISWLMWSDLAIPMRSTLTSLIFNKMMKMKDIKEPPKEKVKESNEAPKDGALNGTTNGHAGGTSTPDIKPKAKRVDNAKPLKTQQDIVNMFTVDTNMVGSFGGINQMYIMFVAKFIVSFVFLWLLIGWQSLMAGMLSIVALYPFNAWLAKRYSGYQKALMRARDRKTAIITEALTGIRQIKFSAEEPQWQKKIEEVRETELTRLWTTKINNLYMMLVSDIAPVFLTVLSLATYSYMNGDLLPSVAFTALGVFLQLEGVLGMIPHLSMMGINAKVSCDRITKFLALPDRPENTHPGDSICFHNVDVTFPSSSTVIEEDRFVLRDITLEFPNNALSVISGPTGSGKSLLLAAILGEVEVLAGHITVPRPPTSEERHDAKATADNWILPSAIAFVSQIPWIENASIRDNILFGLPHDEIRYAKVLAACALTKDLAMFEDGDLTEVGSQGISLSGGQRWRVTLARAFYSRAGTLIMDDVFSALDAHVGKEIYDNALMGELSEGRTRILVTHHVSLCLPRAKYAVRLSARGVLEHAGSTEDLRATGTFDDLLKDDKEPSVETAVEDLEDDKPSKPTDESAVEPKKPKKLVEDEKRETGSVKKSVYFTYLKATGGIPFWTFVLLFYVVAEGLTLSRSWWIKIWTSSSEHAQVEPTHFHTYAYQTTMRTHHHFATAKWDLPFSSHGTLGYYLVGYVLISAVSVVVAVARFYLIYTGSFSASRSVFKQMTSRVLRTPLRWIDTVPTGRILNRFTADFQAMDSALSSNFAQTAASFLEIIGIMIAAFFVSPYIIILAVVLLALCAYTGVRYMRGARSIKRLESIQKSPMISHFSSALTGLSTIRAFSNVPIFLEKMHELVDAYATSTWHNWLFNRWFGLRMALFGSVFSSAVAAFIITTNGVDASLAGFALAFALSYRRSVIQTIRLLANTELDMNAAERVFEYSNLEIEPQGGVEPRASWPEEGVLEVEDLVIGYADGLKDILKGLTFRAETNQGIGVVGRTGAGKSTLSLALFRFLEARSGSITIDGLDISTLNLHALRSRLAIIPQDPVLFSGTIRSNLDPFDQFSDHQLKEALHRVHLIPSPENTPMTESTSPESTSPPSSTTTLLDAPSNRENANPFLSLSHPISSGGSNLSQGQKQLLCLARAILSRPKVLILDEATSAVDMETDTLIQRSIREEFQNTTLLVVAHRLSTVADFDRILVMSDGVASEFGSPRELLEGRRGKGVFKGMVEESGEKEELKRVILGGLRRGSVVRRGSVA